MNKTSQECPVCKSQNDFFVMRCGACGAFLRDRVPNIHLFQTLWMLLETPSRAFRQIAFSEQKNYVYLLHALAGPFLVAAMLFQFSAGIYHPRFERLLDIVVVWGFGIGFIVNSLASLLLTALHSKKTRATLSYRNTSALVAFSIAPLVFASLVLLPIVFAVFGNEFFFPVTQIYKPALFWLLSTLAMFCVLGSLYYVAKFQRVFGETTMRTLMKTTVFGAVLGASVFLGAILIKHWYFP